MTHDAKAALRCAFERERRCVQLDANGYTRTNEENLIDGVCMNDIEADLQQGAGKELDGHFRAVYSSSALVANCFGPFKRRCLLPDLHLLGQTNFDCLQLEEKCSTGLKGIPPTLDAMVGNKTVIIGIESKLTEHLGNHVKADFKKSYKTKKKTWCDIWFKAMQCLEANPCHYKYLDAAQLVKHAFGMGHTCNNGQELHLLYLYWEPVNVAHCPGCVAHREEIKDFSAWVTLGKPSFSAMSYAELWCAWEKAGALAWLRTQIKRLRDRYAVYVWQNAGN